ncbi:unnamed protein product [Sympodiomycopsis kandeliae]
MKFLSTYEGQLESLLDVVKMKHDRAIEQTKTFKKIAEFHNNKNNDNDGGGGGGTTDTHNSNDSGSGTSTSNSGSGNVHEANVA